MRITIIGSGAVGSALARHWGEQGLHDLSFTTTGSAGLAPLQQAEAVVICQTPTGERQVDADRDRATDSYSDSFAGLLELLPQLPALRQIVYTSCASVYGDAAGGWVDESTPASPSDAHGAVLLEAERLLGRCRDHERRVCVLRLGELYGPGLELIPRLSSLAGSRRPGDGSTHGNWIHLDDVVGGIDAAVQNRWDGLVNLVDDHPCTVAALMDRLCAATQLEPVCWQPEAAAGPPAADRRISNRRLHGLGYRLRHPQLVLPRIKAIDQRLLDHVSAAAQSSQRLRSNHNLHRHEEPVQRFLNALQPGTYVRPHRHRRPEPGAGFECFVVLQGSIGLLVLDDRGAVLHRQRLEASGPVRGIELADDQFHTLVALSADAVLLELKQGPYQPTDDKDFLAAFPLEGSPDAQRQERLWRELFEAAAIP